MRVTSPGMLRPVLVFAWLLPVVLVTGGGPAHAGELARSMGMYSAAGTPLPMFESKIDVTVRGAIVETVVTQKFQNRTDRATEATYVFPLPLDAAVTAMSIQLPTRTIRAAIEQRDQAQARYEAAVRAGVAAALLDQERPDVFTQTVAAIPARGTIEISLRYDAMARFSDGTWELVLPMVVAPRYVPGAATGRPTTGTGRSPDTDRAPDASRVTPGGAPGEGGATAVAIHFADAVAAVTSPSHELTGDKRHASFVDPHSDHDAIVRWQTIAPAAGWVEAGGDGGYAAVVVQAAPSVARKAATKLLLVLDRAATMRGDADAVAHPFVRALVAALDATDRIAVTGSDKIGWTAPADALRALEQRWPRPVGAFDLTRVLEAARPEGAAIVLVSDGLVADDRAVVAAAKKLGVAIHVIGVGPAPARGLLTQIAAATGGTIRFAVAGDDLTSFAKATVIDAGTAAAPLTVNWGTLVATEVVPGMLPRLGAGQAMVVLARVKRVQTANARARGELFAIEPLQPARGLDGAITAAGPLARRWARGKLDELVAGVPNEAAITAHALRYGLVSPYTSLVAIGDEVVVEGGVKHSVAVPVSVPAGMRWVEVKAQITVDSTVTLGGESTDKNSTTAKKSPAPSSNRDAARPEVLKNAPASPAPQPAPKRKAEDTREPELDGGSDGEDAPRKLRSEPSSVAMTPGSSSWAAESEEVAVVAGERPRRGFRITAALGGGLALQDQARGVVVLGTRLEAGQRTMVGLEGALWLVSASRFEGHALITFARRGIARWLELGGGLGLHVGEGVGPAASLSVRGHVPETRAAGYLRYDGALLTHDTVREGQNTLTLGVEWGF